jgi:hypothetical protein
VTTPYASFPAVLPGGQIVLTGSFFTFVGSSVPADASDVTLTITPAASGSPVLGPTSTGITQRSAGVYTYAWAPPAATVPGDYTVLWQATGPSGPLTDADVVTVAQAPAETPAPGVYATVTAYRNLIRDYATPDARVASALIDASETLDANALVAAVYEIDEAGMPTNAAVINTLSRACCRQAQFELANNDPAGVKEQYSSTNVGGITTVRAAGSTGRTLPPLAPRAAAILRTDGVLPSAPYVGW